MEKTSQRLQFICSGRMRYSRRARSAWVALTTLLCLSCSVSAQQSRNLAPLPPPSESSWGDYWALLIGINAYKELPTLKTAVNDAQELKTVLKAAYGFREDHIVLRLDREATLSQIDKDLRLMAEQLGQYDNLLIYFAGHGQIDELGDGYWIPVDAKRADATTWLRHERVRSILTSERVRGRHICVVADSCYALTLLRGGSTPPSVDDRRYQERLKELAALKSRQVFTSGGNEPVIDAWREGHSLFAWYLLQALKENRQPAIDFENLFITRIWNPVVKIGGQRPNIGRLPPMDDDGQFVLVRRGPGAEVEGASDRTGTAIKPPDGRSGTPDLGNQNISDRSYVGSSYNVQCHFQEREPRQRGKKYKAVRKDQVRSELTAVISFTDKSSARWRQPDDSKWTSAKVESVSPQSVILSSGSVFTSKQQWSLDFSEDFSSVGGKYVDDSIGFVYTVAGSRLK